MANCCVDVASVHQIYLNPTASVLHTPREFEHSLEQLEPVLLFPFADAHSDAARITANIDTISKNWPTELQIPGNVQQCVGLLCFVGSTIVAPLGDFCRIFYYM